MYCNKLKSICQHEDSSSFGINLDIVKKLDFFIKEKTTMAERRNINPIKFALEMSVNEKTAIMLFVLGAKCDLLKARAFFDCSCGDQHEIFEMDRAIECECSEEIFPAKHKDRVYLYFKLLETPTKCNWTEVFEYQIDYLQGELLGKKYLSLVDIEKIAGEGSVYDLVNQRENKFKNFIEE